MDTPADTRSLLSARALTVSRPCEEGPRRVLDGLDLDVLASWVVDVKGPSGSGKSTLLLALARLLPSWEGELRLEGTPASELDPRGWRARVALLPQRPTLVAGTVAENLSLPFRLKVREGVTPPSAEAMRAGLDSLWLDDVGLERDAAKLSIGQAARVALLRVLLTRPRVLLLDEPDAALDDEAAEAVQGVAASFAEEGGAVVRVRHARSGGRSDRLFEIAAGRLTEVPR